MRSAEFDREQVLRAAIAVFAAKGYNKTSMQDLKKATGLHPGSLYCAFQSKEGLLMAALEQYQKDRDVDFGHYFCDQPQLLDGLRRYINDTVSQCATNGEHKVCLSQKALSELAEQAPLVQQQIRQNVGHWLQDFERVLARAQQQGELTDERSAKQRAQYLVMGLYGLRSYAHADASAEVLQQLADQLFADVCR